MLKIRKEIIDKIRSHDKFLICAHERPDGDAVGASVGLGAALTDMGKKVVVYNVSEPSENVRFLPNIETMTREFPRITRNHLIIVLDAGELKRIGPESQKIKDHGNIINIDHHQTNDMFGRLNYVNEKASSTGELVYKILEDGGFPVSRETAINLFTAIYTDTMALSTPSAKAETFRICGELDKVGIDKGNAAVEYYFRQTERRLRLLSKALSTLTLSFDGRVASIVLYEKDMKETGAGPGDVEGFIDFPRNIQGVLAAAFFRENNGKVKGSLRSGKEVDVAVIAKEIGGGGHARAAGFTASGAMEDVKNMVFKKLEKALFLK